MPERPNGCADWRPQQPPAEPQLDPSAISSVAPRTVGRYALFDPIASGGAGVVHLGRPIGPTDFECVVALKRVHAAMARDADFVATFREENRMLAQIHHPNVALALDVVEDGDELLLVLEYVHGQSLDALIRQARDSAEPIPIEICVAIAVDVLEGLHAAHVATTPSGEPLGIVHRDIAPQNILVGCDGVSRILDFGVAKAGTSRNVTRTGYIEGKLGYLAPEYLLGQRPDLRVDLYGVAVVLWELLASAPLYQCESEVETLKALVSGKVPRLSTLAARSVPAPLERVVLRGLSCEPSARFASAREMALALQEVADNAQPAEVGDWVIELAHGPLVVRSRQLARAENCPLGNEDRTKLKLSAQGSESAASSTAVPRGTFDEQVTRVFTAHAEPPAAMVARFNARPASDERGRALTGFAWRRRRVMLRRGLLYAAALVASASVANTLSKGQLLAKLHGRAVAAEAAAAAATPSNANNRAAKGGGSPADAAAPVK